YPLATHYAVRSRSPAVVRISLENGGDPNKCQGSSHNSPLDECVGEVEHVLEIAELLFEYKADPNAMHGQRLTALQSVVASGSNFSSVRMECAKLLLQHGADPNVGRGTKPIYDAVKRGRTGLVKLLLQHGADPNQAGG
ncbi:ankyrin repeat-containing domain protein, partial [Chaetomium tenue]